MTIFTLLAVSLPEAFLNLVIVILIAGMRDCLKLGKRNTIRFLIALMFMVLSSAVIRPLISNIVPNIVLSFLIHTLIYAVVIAIIYQMDFRKAFLSVLLMGFTFVTLEDAYVPFIIVYISKGIENMYKSGLHVLLYTLPERIVQVCLIVFLWRNQFALEVTKISRKFYNFFSIFVFVLCICELYSSFIFTQYFDKMTLEHQIIYSATLLAIIVVFYLLVYRFIYITVKGLITQGYKQYQELEEGAEKAINTVYNMLEENDVDSAKSFLKELIGKE